MSSIEHRHLRSALEFAVLIAAEGQKRRPPLPYPKQLKPFLNAHRLPASALGRVRRAVEADPDFRRAIDAGALPELVDEVGMLWLGNADGWERAASELVAASDDEAASSDLRTQVKRAEKRRVAAEQAAARGRTELLARDELVAEQVSEIDDLRAEITKARDEIAELRAELVDTRNEVRHARDRERAARARTAAEPGASGPSVAIDATGDDGVAVRLAEVEARLADEREAAADQRRRADALVDASREFMQRIETLVEGPASAGPVSSPAPVRTDGRRQRSGRVAIGLPGGVISTSAEAADFLVRTDARVFVDGYNVAKLAWPNRSLEQQREALIGRCENLARRCATDIVVVFDGSSVTGAHAPSRRSVRVVFSPEGVTADDVIRAEVAGLPDERHVVVVTNDRQIVDDVRSCGANAVPSNAFIAVF